MFSAEVRRDVSLAPYTTFKIGGPAKYFFTARSEEELKKIIQEAKDNQIPYFILGKGSNVLIADEGYKGLVIKLEFNKISFNDKQVIISADVGLGSLMGFCKDKGLSGLEFLAGIPATVGGIIWANAGSDKENIGQLIERVKVLSNNGTIELNNKDCQFAYRDSIFKHQKDYIIIEAVLNLQTASSEIIAEKIKKMTENKLKSQDLEHPSIGSIFKNPAGDKKAWELIRDVDLAGFKMGGAQVSEKHTNFIINTGQATASDVIMLISLIKQKVRDELEIQLMEEIEYVGF
jgi:UDP-N-acetylmuramate dehydrogenase